VLYWLSENLLLLPRQVALGNRSIQILKSERLWFKLRLLAILLYVNLANHFSSQRFYFFIYKKFSDLYHFYVQDNFLWASILPTFHGFRKNKPHYGLETDLILARGFAFLDIVIS
jgi:hypothetical protein